MGLVSLFVIPALIIVSAGPYSFVLRYRSTNEARSPFDTSGRTGIHRAVAETMIKAVIPANHLDPKGSKGRMKMELEAKRCSRKQYWCAPLEGFTRRHSGNLLAGIQACGACGSLCAWIPARRLPE